MATRSSFNKNNSAVKRIMQEARELQNDPSTEYTAAPLEDNLFEWHCTLRGAPDTDFEGGLYHFRIILPAEYPFRPPSLMMLTPSGRFETHTKLCISFTNYHEELWQPAWGVRTAIIGLQGFFPLKGQAAMGVGSMEAPGSERRRLAKLSRDWVCPQCKIPNRECLPDPLPIQEDSQGASSCTKTADDSYGNANTDTNVAPRVTATAMSETTETDSSSDTAEASRTATTNPGESADLCVSSEHLSAQEKEDKEKEREANNANAASSSSLPPASAELSRVDPERIDSKGSTEAERVRSLELDRHPEQDQDQEQRKQTSAVEVIVSAASSTTIGAASGSHTHGHTHSPSSSASSSSSSSRPPILLDATISVLLVLVVALLARKVL